MIYRIVEGNSLELHVLVGKRDLSKDFDRLVDYDLREVTNLRAVLSGCYDERTVAAKVSGVGGNEVVLSVPGDLGVDVYDLRLSWCASEGEEQVDSVMQSVERRLLQVVTHNGKTLLPIGLQEGEKSGLFDMRYYVVTENQTQCPVSYILDNVESDKADGSMANGKPLTANLTATDGYSLGLVKVVMNGRDVTDEVYAHGVVNIPAVSGWVNVIARGDMTEWYAGASAAKDVGELDLDALTRQSDSIVGKTVAITTTDEANVAWVVSREPVAFVQAGMEAPMHSRRVGDLWYYWSDELSAGENEYSVKQKE